MAILVDHNTWNNTHIRRVGQVIFCLHSVLVFLISFKLLKKTKAMASPEGKAYEIMRTLNVDNVSVKYMVEWLDIGLMVMISFFFL